MAYPHPLSPQEALIYIMVMTAAADRDMANVEFQEIGRTVKSLPIFSKFDLNQLVPVAESCADALTQSGDLEKLLKDVRAALPDRLHETAYALAVDVAVADLQITAEEENFLDMLAEHLQLDNLSRAAIERGARARHMVV